MPSDQPHNVSEILGTPRLSRLTTMYWRASPARLACPKFRICDDS